MKLLPFTAKLWAAGACGLIMAFAAKSSYFSIPAATAVPLFLLLVITVAWRAGFGASLITAVVATLSLDYFFTVPRHSFRVDSIGDMVTLATFASTSTLVSHLSHRTRIKTDQLQHAEEQQRLLYESSRTALLIDWNGPVETQLCHLLYERFRLTLVAIYTAEDQTLAVSGEASSVEERIRASFRAQKSYDLLNGAERLRILRFGSRPIGALMLRGHLEAVVMDSLATMVATHLVRTRAVRSDIRAQSQAFSESLRATVLDGLAHTIKTPLTTIIVSSSGLREIGPLTTVQNELAETIEEQAKHLNQVTNKLLQMAHLASEDIQVNRSLVDLGEACQQIEAAIQPRSDADRMIISGLPAKPFAMDQQLFHLLLLQVIENALKYSPATSAVRVKFSCVKQCLEIAVHNEGSFIPPAERSVIFERYYRSAATAYKASGTGIGLSVARSAVEAMHGRIWADSSPESGTTFHISLPEVT